MHLLGEVPSATAFLATLSAMVYPATCGSGTKVKVLESIAVGVPVVTTQIGAEGIAPGNGILVCESDDGLVSAAATLLTDGVARRARGVAASATFARHHAPAAAMAPLAALYRRMLSVA